MEVELIEDQPAVLLPLDGERVVREVVQILINDVVIILFFWFCELSVFMIWVVLLVLVLVLVILRLVFLFFILTRQNLLILYFSVVFLGFLLFLFVFFGCLLWIIIQEREVDEVVVGGRMVMILIESRQHLLVGWVKWVWVALHWLLMASKQISVDVDFDDVGINSADLKRWQWTF
jgi:hypothetical protein